MKLIKVSSIFAVLGFVFLALSFFAAKGLEETKKYSFPESVGRHYARVSGKVFEGGGFGGENATLFKKSVPMGSSFPFDTVEIETTAVNVEISESKSDEVEIELLSNRIDPKEPVLIDSNRGKTLRIMTQEGNSDRSAARGWFVFNFDSDSLPIKNNLLQVRVPKSISIAKLQTVSGSGRLATVLSSLHFQSKSGNFSVETKANPLARVTDLTFESVSGDLRSPGRFDHLHFNSVSGNIRLKTLDRLLSVDGHSVSGDIVLESREPLDAEIQFQSTSGDVKVASFFGVKKGDGPKRNAPFVFGRGTTKIHVQSISGNLQIRRGAAGLNNTLDESDDSGEKHGKSGEDAEDTSDEDSSHRAMAPATYAVTRVGNATPLASGAFMISKKKIAAEDFLRCVATIAVKEATRMGQTSFRRCIRVVV